MTSQTQAAAAAAPAALPRRFGLLQATALNMSTMIGVGPFITIPVLMTAMGGPQAMLGWLVALVIACSDGLVWSELGAMMPGSGGSYVYLRDAFGPEKLGRAVSFLFIWQFLLSGPLEIASGYIGFAQYASYLWPGLGANGSRLLMAGVGILIIFLLYRRITQIGRITICLWIGTLLTVGAVILIGPFHFDPKLAFDFPPGAFSFSLGFVMGLGAAARVGVYDYLGYYDVCYIGDEVRNPGRVIPRSILISLVAVAAIYMTMNLLIVGVVPWRQFVPPAGRPWRIRRRRWCRGLLRRFTGAGWRKCSRSWCCGRRLPVASASCSVTPAFRSRPPATVISSPCFPASTRARSFRTCH